MKTPRFATWFSKLSLLNQPQRLRMLDALHPAAGLDQTISLIGEIRPAGRSFPCCRALLHKSAEFVIPKPQSESWHRQRHSREYAQPDEPVEDSGTNLQFGDLAVKDAP